MDQHTLRERAAQQYATITDRSVFNCWHVVVEAVDQRWLTVDALPGLIEDLESGGGRAVEEYGIEVSGPGEVEVAFLDERYTCARWPMIAELRTLAGLPAADVRGARAVLDALAHLAASPGSDTEAAARVRDEARRVLDDWHQQDSDGDSADELRTAAGQLDERQRGDLAAALRSFADWAERPDDSRSGAGVDAVISQLERTLGPLLESGRRAESERANERITADARDSIAWRIEEAGGRLDS